MSRKLSLILFPLLTYLSLIFLNPQVVSAAVIISPIGDISLGEQRSVAVSGLAPNSKYVWIEFKSTGTFPYKSLTKILSECLDSDSSGEIKKDIGPYPAPGIYDLIIYGTVSDCKPGHNPHSIEFSVGGKIEPEQACCNLPFPIYDRGKDICKSQIIDLPVAGNPSQSTLCAAKGAFCEPDSLRCFSNKNSTFNSKICLDPENPKSEAILEKNKDKYTMCTKVGGEITNTSTTQADDSSDDSSPNLCPSPDGGGTGFKIGGCFGFGGLTSLGDATSRLVVPAFSLAATAVVIYFLLGSFKFLTSGGNKEDVAEGRNMITHAIIGFIILIFAFLMLQFLLARLFGITGFQLFR